METKKHESKLMIIKQASLQEFFNKYSNVQLMHNDRNGTYSLHHSFMVKKDVFPSNVDRIEFELGNVYSSDFNEDVLKKELFKVEAYDDISLLCTCVKRTIVTSDKSIVEVVKKEN